MLLTMEDWKEMREKFSDEEKAALNAAIIGETVCPRGCVLDEVKLGPEMIVKIKTALYEPKRSGYNRAR